MDICSAPITALTAAKIVSAIFMVPVILLFTAVVFYWTYLIFVGKDDKFGAWLVTTFVTGIVATTYTFFLFS